MTILVMSKRSATPVIELRAIRHTDVLVATFSSISKYKVAIEKVRILIQLPLKEESV